MNRYDISDGQLLPTDIHYIEMGLDDGAPTTDDPNALLALRLPNAADPEDIVPFLDWIAAVIVEFPKFADGRAYTQARILRDYYQFRGRIIATGDVLPDQLFFMVRCGIDVIEVEANNLDTYQRALGSFSHVYQRASDALEPISVKRQKPNLSVGR